MFGFKKPPPSADKPDRNADIERACSAAWLEFAASAAASCETTIVLRAGENPKEAVHYALCAEMREHVVGMIKQMIRPRRRSPIRKSAASPTGYRQGRWSGSRMYFPN